MKFCLHKVPPLDVKHLFDFVFGEVIVAVTGYAGNVEYKHASILDESTGEIIEAVAPTVRRRVPTEDEWKDIDIFEVTTNDAQDESMIFWLNAQVGVTEYGWDIDWAFVTKLAPHEQHKVICSMLVFLAFQQVGVELLLRIPPERVSPTQLQTTTKAYGPMKKGS